LLFLFQLLPSPKWKLVVDVGEAEPIPVENDNASAIQGGADVNDICSDGEKVHGGKDPRIDAVVSLLGEFMPSDPNSALAPFLSGFMSLRLLLLRSSRSPEEEDRARTMLDSYTSYSLGGRSKADIGILLARDYMFLLQQPAINIQPMQASFFNLGQGTANAAQAPSLSGNFFDFDVHHSPMLGPISINDTLSIVSNS
jgi:hypothetical protein